MSFPTRLEDITPEWLSDVFGSKVSFTLETLGEGPGYVCLLYTSDAADE